MLPIISKYIWYINLNKRLRTSGTGTGKVRGFGRGEARKPTNPHRIPGPSKLDFRCDGSTPTSTFMDSDFWLFDQIAIQLFRLRARIYLFKKSRDRTGRVSCDPHVQVTDTGIKPKHESNQWYHPQMVSVEWKTSNCSHIASSYRLYPRPACGQSQSWPIRPRARLPEGKQSFTIYELNTHKTVCDITS